METYLYGSMDYAKMLKLQIRVGDLDVPERRKRCTSSREEEEEDAQMCPCGKAQETRTHFVGECEMYKEERDVLEMKKMGECDMEKFGTLDNGEKTIAILGDRWWSQTTKQQGDKISKKIISYMWKKRNDRPNVGGFSIGSRNGAPSRKGRVVNDPMTNASNK